MQVVKSTRYYRDKNALSPGTLFLYKNNIYVLSGSITNGQYLRAFGDSKTNYPTKNCKILKENTGLVFL